LIMAINKYIDKIGLEIEGAWYNGQPYNLHTDGSVSARADHTGESVSDPMESWRAVRDFITDNYPDEHNSSCGLHVHFSFNSLGIYSRLMDKEFHPYFTGAMKAWGEENKIQDTAFWDRLNGRNQYCLSEWRADNQAMQRTKNSPRYCHWNFCYGLHKTAECRLLPVFGSSDNAILAVGAVGKCVMAWLGKVNKSGVMIETITEPVMEDNQTRLAIAGGELDTAFDIQPLIYKEIACV